MRRASSGAAATPSLPAALCSAAATHPCGVGFRSATQASGQEPQTSTLQPWVRPLAGPLPLAAALPCACRNVFEAVLFLLIAHAYDVGDLLQVRPRQCSTAAGWQCVGAACAGSPQHVARACRRPHSQCRLLACVCITGMGLGTSATGRPKAWR